MILGNRERKSDEEQEQILLKCFTIVGAIAVIIFFTISRWIPSLVIPIRIAVLTGISFGTAIIIKRKELSKSITWVIFASAGFIHFVVLWRIRDFIATTNIWMMGIGAIAEGLVLLVLIEMSKPPNERWR